MHCPALVLWLLVGLVYHAQAQDSQDNQTAVPIWSQVSGSKFGTNNICNGTFADFNATGIFNFNPNKAGSNSLIRDTGLAFTIQSAPNTTSDPSNATSSSWGLWWNTDGANLTNKFSLGYDLCAVVGILNYNTNLRGQTDDGSCSSTLDDTCIADIQEVTQQYADWLTTPSTLGPGSNLTSTTLPNLCSTLAGNVRDNMPQSCSYFFQDPNIIVPAFALTSYGNDYPILVNPGCTVNGTYQNSVSGYNNNSLSNYDSWAQSVIPVISVFMPIADSARASQATSPLISNSVAELTCVHINHINNDSYEPPPAPSPTPIVYRTTSNSTGNNNTTTSTPAPTQKSSSSGLSGGAIAGIVIGILAALALLAAGVFLFWRRRKNHGKTTGESGDAQQPSREMQQQSAELGGQQIHELPLGGKAAEQNRKLSELDATGTRHEVP